MKFFKTYATVFGSIVLACAPIAPVNSCAFDEGWEYQGYNLFLQDVANIPAYQPLYFSYETYYSSWENDSAAGRSRDNLAEWVQYFGGKHTKTELDSLIYGSAAYFEREKRKYPMPVSEYIGFARECEPLVFQNFGIEWWDEKKPLNEGQMSELLQEAVTAAKGQTDKFLRRRYAFQAIRLAHYAKEMELCVHLFQELFTKDTEPSLARWWSMGHKAGALDAQGLDADALLLYADVFMHCPSRRNQMHLSAQWLTASDTSGEAYQQALALAKTPAEKIGLHVLRAAHPKANGIEEMRTIADLDPSSDYLTLLLVREMAKVEQALMGYNFDYAFPANKGTALGRWSDNSIDRMAGLKHLAALQTFIRAKTAAGKLANPQVWQLSDGYLSYLNNDTKTARATLAAFTPTTDLLAQQKAIFLFAIDLAELKRVDAEAENAFAKRFNALKFANEYLKQNTSQALNKTFQRLYTQQGDVARAFFCTNTIQAVYNIPTMELVQAMRTWLKTRSRSEYDRYLRTQVNGSEDALFVAEEMYATLLLREGKFGEAQQILAAINPESLKDYSYTTVVGEPFSLHMNDCQECAAAKGVIFSKLDFAQRAAQFQTESNNFNSSAEARAIALFSLGNIWYNTSYYGASWGMLAYYRSGSFSDNTAMDSVCLQRSIKAFEEVMKLSKNKELQAQAIFGIAKCHRAVADEEMLLASYGALKKAHKSSDFFEKALKECSYLNVYNKTGKAIFPNPWE